MEILICVLYAAYGVVGVVIFLAMNKKEKSFSPVVLFLMFVAWPLVFAFAFFELTEGVEWSNPFYRKDAE